MIGLILFDKKHLNRTHNPIFKCLCYFNCLKLLVCYDKKQFYKIVIELTNKVFKEE